MPGDASARSYTRLRSPTAETAILMDAVSNRDSLRPFVRIAEFLNASGLSAPSVLKCDDPKGLLVVSDLGTETFAHHLDHLPSDRFMLYDASCAVLAQIASLKPPSDLSVLSPDIAAEMVVLTGNAYANSDLLGAELAGRIRASFDEICGPPDFLALRDFHAENLIWRESLDGLARVGLLDFQDALVAPLGYDLVSLLRDARRDVDTDISERVVDRFSQSQKVEPKSFAAQLACLGVQRNLRILGVFARLVSKNGKSQYGALLPRVWGNLLKDLDHPAMHDLRSFVLRALPTPDQAMSDIA